jgi:hypothetical protein
MLTLNSSLGSGHAERGQVSAPFAGQTESEPWSWTMWFMVGSLAVAAAGVVLWCWRYLGERHLPAS